MVEKKARFSLFILGVRLVTIRVLDSVFNLLKCSLYSRRGGLVCCLSFDMLWIATRIAMNIII